MCFTVIRAYRVKSVSSHCETVPMWTSNYWDGISASSGWKGFNCSSVFFEDRKWIDETWQTCEIAPPLQKRASSYFITPTFVSSFFPLVPKLFSKAPAALKRRKWRHFCQLLVISHRAPQWMWSLFRSQRLHTALFCWALGNHCVIVGLYCAWASDSLLSLTGCGASRRGVIFRAA